MPDAQTVRMQCRKLEYDRKALPGNNSNVVQAVRKARSDALCMSY